MKRFLKLGALSAMLAVTLCACTKEGSGRFKGNYSFKTSGTVSIREKGNEAAEISILKLTDEQGQMDIIKTGDTDDGMVVTMNILTGSVLVFDAIADGDALELLEEARSLSLKHGLTGQIGVNADVLVSGVGHRYGDSVIFELSYKGGYEAVGVEYEIVDCDVKCVAKLN